MSTLFVVAIDFGTTRTGYAILTAADYANNKLDIKTDQAWKGTPQIGQQAPTSALFCPDKTFHSFGFEAEKKYKDLSFHNQQHGWFVFRQFKIHLYQSHASLKRTTVIGDVAGKKMEAMKVFAESLGYIKRHVTDRIKDNYGPCILDEEVHWVVTVPAIWDESANQFMREAVDKAGFATDQVCLAVEPEAAAIYCKELILQRQTTIDSSVMGAFNPGKEYLVLDLGGGTVDVTAHRIQSDGKIKHIVSASGGPWGGKIINDAFQRAVRRWVGEKVFSKFIKEHHFEWLQLEKEFEDEKLTFSPGETLKLRFPDPLIRLYKEEADLTTRIANIYKDGRVELCENGYLVLNDPAVREYFSHAVEKIKDHVTQMFEHPEVNGVDTILLVGGFAESKVVKEAIKTRFKTKTVVIPPNSSMAILKGAALYGHDKNVIAARISPFTYGIKIRRRYSSEIYPLDKSIKIGGETFIDDVFHTHIEAGESVYVGQAKRNIVYKLSNIPRGEVVLKIYKSSMKDPQFCDTPDCIYIGVLRLKLPEYNGEIRKLSLRMICKGTELYAIAVDEVSQQECHLKMDFLENEYELDSDFLLFE